MKRQNMLERSIVLVSGPDCFSREFVCACVTFHCFIALWVLCVYREQWLFNILQSYIVHIIKFLKNTL